MAGVAVDWVVLVGLVAGLALGTALPSAVRRVRARAMARAAAHARQQHLDQLGRQQPAQPDRPLKLQPPRLPAGKLSGPYLYLTELRLQNLRCFANTRLSLRFPGEGSDLRLPNVNLLLGDNGSGKSTVLRAAAMTALGPVLDSSGFVPYRLVRDGASSAVAEATLAFRGSDGPQWLYSKVELERRGDYERVHSTTESPLWEQLYDESSPSFFVAGYGVNRRVADEAHSDPSLERGRRRRRYQRVSSLFEENVALVPFGSWLPAVDRRRRAQVERLLRQLLPHNAFFTGSFDGAEAVFERHGVQVPFRALSDGFRSYLGWLGDLMFHITAVAPKQLPLDRVGGIVLVDEIDLLLHPSWQRDVVPTVSRMFPNIQFIFTTHSPIVTGTLQAGNVSVAREVTERGPSVLDRVSAEVHGLNAEQVLLSSYFELVSTRDRDAASDLQELARQAVDGDEDARRRYLAALIEGFPAGDGRQ